MALQEIFINIGWSGWWLNPLITDGADPLKAHFKRQRKRLAAIARIVAWHSMLQLKTREAQLLPEAGNRSCIANNRSNVGDGFLLQRPGRSAGPVDKAKNVFALWLRVEVGVGHRRVVDFKRNLLQHTYSEAGHALNLHVHRLPGGNLMDNRKDAVLMLFQKITVGVQLAFGWLKKIDGQVAEASGNLPGIDGRGLAMISPHGLDVRVLVDIGHSQRNPSGQNRVDVLQEPRDAVDGLIVSRQLRETGTRQKAHYSKTAQKFHLPLRFSEISMQAGRKMKKLRRR